MAFVVCDEAEQRSTQSSSEARTGKSGTPDELNRIFPALSILKIPLEFLHEIFINKAAPEGRTSLDKRSTSGELQ